MYKNTIARLTRTNIYIRKCQEILLRKKWGTKDREMFSKTEFVVQKRRWR